MSSSTELTPDGSRKKRYYAAIKITAIMHLVGGAILVSLGIAAIVQLAYWSYFATSIWSGIVIYILTGLLGLGASSQKNRCLNAAYIILLVVACLMSTSLIFMYSFATAYEEGYLEDDTYILVCQPGGPWTRIICVKSQGSRELYDALIAITATLELIVCLVSAFYSCCLACTCCEHCCTGACCNACTCCLPSLTPRVTPRPSDRNGKNGNIPEPRLGGNNTEGQGNVSTSRGHNNELYQRFDSSNPGQSQTSTGQVDISTSGQSDTTSNEQVIRQIAHDLDDDSMHKLGTKLGFKYNDIERFVKMNHRGDISSSGGRKMLFDWRKKIRMTEEMNKLQEALTNANLLHLVSTVFPDDDTTI